MSNRGSIKGSVNNSVLHNMEIEEDEDLILINKCNKIEISFIHILQSRVSSDIEATKGIDKTKALFKSLKTLENIYQKNHVHNTTIAFPMNSKNHENAPCGIPLKQANDPYCIIELMYMSTMFKRQFLI